MKIRKILLLMIIGIFCFIPVVNAKDEVLIKGISPFDISEGIEIYSYSNVDLEFNDLGQSTKYEVTLKNNSNKDLYVNSLAIDGSSQNFIKYTLDEKSRSKVIKSGDKEDIVINVSANNEKGAGRNLSDNISFKLLLNDKIENPNTNSNLISTIILVIISAIAITFVMTKFNNKKGTIATVIVCFMLLGTSFVFADDTVVVNFKGKVKYSSQNLLSKSPTTVISGKATYITDYFYQVKNININNEIIEIKDPVFVQDLTVDGKKRVMAYVVANGDQSIPYDIYMMSNGVIYAPEDATGLFSFPNVETINGLENVIFDNTTKMTGMFIGNEKLNKVDLTTVDTTNVKDTSYMFYRNYRLELDESKFNLEKVENKTQMFNESNLYKIIENSHDGTTIKKYTGYGYSDYENDVYYYYGNATNNNIRFANFCWKIVRTTETGGIKLLYSGIPSEDGSCSNTGENLTIGRTPFNEKTSLDDVSYVYDDGKDSIMKTYIDLWYKNNMTKYTEKLEDSVWCNNRIYSGGGSFVSPDGLSCPDENDALTVKSKKLKYPVALLTENELLLAGLVRNRYTESYLNSGNPIYVYTMSPYWESITMSVYGVDGVQEQIVNENSFVRPAISLNNSAKIIAGIGTSSEPYVVE